jgi:NAD(P)-dependent dehydrogenase (short-subunit alcohol dehydrogenase family)
MMRFDGKSALITGAGSGIGKRTALLLAAEGARVAVLSRTTEEVQQTVDEIRDAGGEATCVCADVADADEVSRAIDEIGGAFGALDIVFANAGINGVWAPLEDLKPDEWDATIAINLRGTFLTLKYSLPYMKKRGGSIIVNASINGTRVFSNTGATAYAASKAGQVAMVKMLALELAEHGIRINAVCPGAIETEIEDNTQKRGTHEIGVPVEFPRGWHPLGGKPGTADEVARVVLFLASDEASRVTGTEIWIDGGESLVGING